MTFKLVGDNLRQKPKVSKELPVCKSCGKPHLAGQCKTTQEAKDVPADRRM